MGYYLNPVSEAQRAFLPVEGVPGSKKFKRGSENLKLLGQLRQGNFVMVFRAKTTIYYYYLAVIYCPQELDVFLQQIRKNPYILNWAFGFMPISAALQYLTSPNLRSIPEDWVRYADSFIPSEE